MPEEEIDQYESYRIVRTADGRPYKLGSGGMGITYKAVNTSLDLIVALKVIKAELLNRDILARDRFVREAKIAASIRHPNVATVYHLGEVGQQYYYAMEFIGGDTLEERVAKRGPFPVANALAVIDQAARALRAAHRNGLVHRDVKPANLMFTEEEEGGEAEVLKLIDFGLAKSVGDNLSAGQLTQPGQRAGFTPLYGSPEQCQYLEADARSDIYSLGVTLWFALIGQPPFQPTAGRKSAEQIFELQSKHVSAEPPMEVLEAAKIPAPVRRLLGDMLEKDPAARPQTAVELRTRIEQCLEAIGRRADAPEEPLAAPYSFNLEELLRQRGQLAWGEVCPLLGSLAAIADDLAASGAEALEKFTPRRVRAVFPSYAPAGSSSQEDVRPSAALARPAEWPAICADYRLEPRIGEESNGGETVALDATQPPAPRRPRDAVEALASLVYELLDGHPPDIGRGDVLKPLPAVGEAGSFLLRGALGDGGERYGGSAKRFAEALATAAGTGVTPPPNRPPAMTAPPPRGHFPWKLVSSLVALGMAAALVVHWQYRRVDPTPSPAITSTASPTPTQTTVAEPRRSPSSKPSPGAQPIADERARTARYDALLAAIKKPDTPKTWEVLSAEVEDYRKFYGSSPDAEPPFAQLESSLFIRRQHLDSDWKGKDSVGQKQFDKLAEVKTLVVEKDPAKPWGDDARKKLDEVEANVGDYLYYGAEAAECLRSIAELRLMTDAFLATKKGQIRPEVRQYLKAPKVGLAESVRDKLGGVLKQFPSNPEMGWCANVWSLLAAGKYTDALQKALTVPADFAERDFVKDTVAAATGKLIALATRGEKDLFFRLEELGDPGTPITPEILEKVQLALATEKRSDGRTFLGGGSGRFDRFNRYVIFEGGDEYRRMGRTTQDAILRFQCERSLEMTGKLSPETLFLLGVPLGNLEFPRQDESQPRTNGDKSKVPDRHLRN